MTVTDVIEVSDPAVSDTTVEITSTDETSSVEITDLDQDTVEVVAVADADSVTEVTPLGEVVVDISSIGGTGAKGEPGDPGQPGPPGPIGGVISIAYTYYQNSAASVWTIHHSLGFQPNVTIVDSAGTNVEGDVGYPDNNTVIVTFTSAFGGVAYLS